MKPPPFLLGAVLLFWGWETGHFFLAPCCALLLELVHWVKWRWNFDQTDLNRIWDVCMLLMGGVSFYSYSSQERTTAAYIFFQSLPVLILPIVAAQYYSGRERLPLSTFSWLLRRKSPRAWEDPGLHTGYPFFAFCLLGTAATNHLRSNLFYLGICFLLGWALWRVRPRRAPAALWCCLLLLVSGLGYLGHQQLSTLQTVVEGQFSEWISNLWHRETNPNESRTSIGTIGKLKLSGRIMLRVEMPQAGQTVPGLLRESSYNLYRNETWSCTLRDFVSVPEERSDKDGFSWRFFPEKTNLSLVRISRFMAGRHTILALPPGMAMLGQMPAEIATNRYGVVRASEAPSLVRYEAVFGPGATIDIPPDLQGDLLVPEFEQGPLNEVIREMGLEELRKSSETRPLSTQEQEEVMRRIAGFLSEKFTYSLHLQGKGKWMHSPLSHLGLFLTKTRSGHCEYFATSTVLLLRQMHIPARYATGFSVQEPVQGEPRRFVVRERHAHAWSLVYRGGTWIDLDTTPSGWEALEARTASFWEPMQDLWSKIWYEFSRWRWLGDRSEIKTYLAWLLVPLVILLLWRFRHNRARRLAKAPGSAQPVVWPGLDSEFYQLEKRLTELGYPRDASQTVTDWLHRLPADLPLPQAMLAQIKTLHYRHRFDPRGLSSHERAQLREAVLACLKPVVPAPKPS